MTIEPAEQTKYKPEFLSRLKVDGKYAPSATELVKLFKRIDLVDEFKNTQLLEQSDGELSLSFDSLEHAHLFAFLLIEKAIESNLMGIGLSEQDFDGHLLSSFRLDGNQLAYSESKNVDKVIGNLQVISHSLDQYRDGQPFKIMQLIRSTVESAMPHLKGEVKDFLPPVIPAPKSTPRV